MKTNVYLGVGVRIIILFLIGFLATYIPETLNRLDATILNDHDLTWNNRHYWLNTLFVILFIWSLINLIVSSYNIITKYYPQLK